MTRSVFWFRRDLRIRDNVGLHKTRAQSEEMLCLFVVDPTHSEWPHRCGDRLDFKLEALANLREMIRDNGGELYTRQGKHGQVIPKFVKQVNADRVSWNRCYEPYERKRDKRVEEALVEQDVTVETFKDQVLFEKEEILTNDGSPYQVFTYYSKKWKSHPKPEPVSSVEDFQEADVFAGEIPDVKSMGLERHIDSFFLEPNQSEARSQAEEFLDGPVLHYDEHRDYPAKEATSRLSPYLRFGLISARTLVEEASDRWSEADRTDGIETFVEELIWRDFYHQVLYNYPHVVDSNFHKKYDDVKWEDHPEWEQAWKEGCTGYPIVDAAMRQLNATGWMHNRLRMIVAMFLTKDCLIHWKVGEKFFMNRLLDGDTAANNGGWQWSSSTGTDAAPYFRIFNPVSQSERYDPEGEFIKKYCPELEDLPPDHVHDPSEAPDDVLSEAGVTLGESYPEPILDHDERRTIAEGTFKRVVD